MTTYDLYYHDLEVEGSIHKPNNFRYADQATRKSATGLTSNDVDKWALQVDDGSMWRRNASSGWDATIPPSPVVGDIGKVAKVVSDGDGGVKLEWSIDTSNNLDQAYGAFGGPGTVTIDAGNLTWATSGAYDHIVDISSAGNANGFFVNSAGGYYHKLTRVTAGGEKLFNQFSGTLFESTTTGQADFTCQDFLVTATDSITMTADKNSELTVTGIGNTFLLAADNLYNQGQYLLLQQIKSKSSGNFADIIHSSGGGLNGASGIQSFMFVEPKIDQSGTAAYNGILVDVEQNSTGSGEKNLLNLKLNSANRFRVDTTGKISSVQGADFGDNVQIIKSQNAATKQLIQNTNDSNLAVSQIELRQGTAVDHSLLLGAFNGSYATTVYQNRGGVFTDTDSEGIFFAARKSDATIDFYCGESSPTNARLSILGTGNVRIGTGTPSYATGAGDLYVTGALECDGLLYADAGIRTTSAIYGSGNDFSVGAADFTSYGFIRWSSTAQTPNTNLICTGNISNAYVMCEYADRSYDFSHSQQTNPTLFIQSANQSTTEWGSFAHDQTHFRIKTGTGATCIGTGTPGSATGLGDLYVTDALEVDGTIHADLGVTVPESVTLTLGVAGNSKIQYAGNQTAKAAMWGLPATSDTLILCQQADTSFNFAHAAATNPTLFIQSANQSTTEWGSFAHDQTHFRIKTGTGAVCVGTGTPSFSTGPGDLYVSDNLEVSTKINLIGSMFMTGGNHTGLSWGTGSNPTRFYMNETNDQLLLAMGSDLGRQLVLGELAYATSDYGHATPTNPTLFGHAATDPAGAGANHWWSQTHNQTDAVKGIGKGGHVTNHAAPVSLADDASFDLPANSTGFGFLIVGDSEEYAYFTWSSTETVTLVQNSANVVTTDTDTKFCIFNNTGKVSIKNRLGTAKEVVFDYHYTT
jgi:hypothetical protein